MNHGFRHFPSNHLENFVASTLLLLLETDPHSRAALCRRLRSAAGLTPEGAELLDLGREATLTGANGELGYSDLWLRFPEGVLLVELKKPGWPVAKVRAQLERYRDGTLAKTGEPPIGAVLVAPRVLGGAAPAGFVSWGEVIRGIREAGPEGALAKRVIAHLEKQMERDIGLAEGGRMDVREVARQVASLKSFLRSCALEIGGDPEPDAIYTTPSDGEPLRRDGWAWHGVSVPFVLGRTRFRVGVYHYAEAPDGEEAALKHAWLEAYQANSDSPLVELPFDGSLAPDDLDRLRTLFRDAWKGRTAEQDEQ